MSTNLDLYRTPGAPIPETTWAWNMYGAGIENIGVAGEPELFPIPDVGDHQILVRVDAVCMCYSDLKLNMYGEQHPKLSGYDLAKEPIRLGHEVSLTVVEVGKELQDQYQPGQRFAVQPDIYRDDVSTGYGYVIPGGLIQYQLIGPEVLETDTGASLLPLVDEIGYAEAALLEPWGCVLAAYSQRRRLAPIEGGIMWILGRADDERVYEFSSGLEAPRTIVVTDAPTSVLSLVERTRAQVMVRDGLSPEDYGALSDEFTNGRGFDDIVALDPRAAKVIGAAAQLIARHGTFNMVGQSPLDGMPQIDVGRIHYDFTAYMGNTGPDIATSYGEERNRCDLTPDGIALFMGAGGPMGQMHVQRALELANGPRLIIVTEIDDMRLAVLRDRLLPLAEQRQRELLTFNPSSATESLANMIMQLTKGQGVDDAVVCVPEASLMAEAAALMNPNGMLVLFAGVPNGTLAPLNLSAVYTANAQFTGTSGLTIKDQAFAMGQTLEGTLSPARSVAAIGGMETVQETFRALLERRYPGKIAIFPQITGLPLTGLDKLEEQDAEIACHLGEGNTWTTNAEQALIEKYWRPTRYC